MQNDAPLKDSPSVKKALIAAEIIGLKIATK